jgi:ATP-dependent Clp protease ATP-binding subunit ClpA
VPKINVYLPDDLAAAVREAGLSVSPVCQRALAEAVRVISAAREAVEAMREPDFDPQQQPQVGAGVAARMTGHLCHALERARDLAGSDSASARELAGSDRLVETEHLLLGVIDEPDNLGTQVLRSLDVDVDRLRDAAVWAGQGHAGKGAPRRSRSRKPPSLSAPRLEGRREQVLGGLSITARLAIAAALEGAVDLGHEFLGCEHLVLGLAGQPDGAAGELLRDLGVDPDSVRRAIPPALAAAALGYSNARRLFAPAMDGRLDEIIRRLDEFEARLSAGGL